MKKWKLIVGVALVFVLGVLVGSVGTRFHDRDWSDLFWKDHAAKRAVFLQRLTRELQLTEEQQKEFKAMVEETDKKLEAHRLEGRAGAKKIFDESFSRMKEKLDPGQQDKLADLKARHEARTKDQKRHGLFP